MILSRYMYLYIGNKVVHLCTISFEEIHVITLVIVYSVQLLHVNPYRVAHHDGRELCVFGC